MSKPPRITKAHAAAFRKRWKLLNDREAEELRKAAVEIKSKQVGPSKKSRSKPNPK